MRPRFISLTVLVAAFMAWTIVAAYADSVNGQGQTPLGASLGFNADSDLAGQLTYNSDPNGTTPDFWAQCDDYTGFKPFTTQSGGQRALVTGTCLDNQGNTVYMRASFTDNGEPGTSDVICVLWSYTSPRVRVSNAYIHDHGLISNGNIQYHSDEANPAVNVIELVTPTV